MANAFIQATIDAGKLETLNNIANYTAHNFQTASQFSTTLNADVVALRSVFETLEVDLEKLGVDIHSTGKAYYETLGIVDQVVAESLKLPDDHPRARGPRRVERRRSSRPCRTGPHTCSG